MKSEKIIQILGKGIVVSGNDIDTDRIIPARYLKEITFANMGNYAFYDERFEENGNMKKHSFNEDKFKGASILVANKNFGCGSSREHAPQSLMRSGIKAIIAESFADIFAGNCRMIGLPTATIKLESIQKLMNFIENNPSEILVVDLQKKELAYNNSKLNFEMSNSLRDSLMEGTWDSTSVLLEAKDDIKKVVSRLPYLNNFT